MALLVTHLPYMAINLFTARDVVFYLGEPLDTRFSDLPNWNRGTKIYFIYESVVLSSLAIEPLVSTALSYRSLLQCSNLAQNHREYKGILIVLIVTNVIAVLCELCGTAVIVYSVLSASPEINIRYGVFLVHV
jgi:hypothetical protein